MDIDERIWIESFVLDEDGSHVHPGGGGNGSWSNRREGRGRVT